MKKYECLYIVNINFDSEGISAVTARVEEVLKNVGAELANSQHWGKRKLAYAIDKERYGNYILLHFQGENPNIAELHREFEIESGVLHYMTIRLDEFPDFDALTVPQAYEADRGRRPSSHGDRRPPRRYDNDEKTAPVAVEAADKPAADAVVAEDAVEKPATDTVPAEDVAEVVEEVTEEPAAAEEETAEVATEEPAPETAKAEETPEVVEEVAEEPEAVKEPAEDSSVEESAAEADDEKKAADAE